MHSAWWEFGGAIVSLGYAGRAVLVDGDGSAALYAYECENWNCKDDAPKLDGEIYIEFEPIATARKIVRTKRYPQGVPLNGMAENVDFYELMEAGCSRCATARTRRAATPTASTFKRSASYRRSRTTFRRTERFPRRSAM